MSKQGKHIDDFLKDALGEAPDAVAGLGWESFTTVQRKKRRVIFFRVAIAALILLSGTWFITKQLVPENELTEINNPEENEIPGTPEYGTETQAGVAVDSVDDDSGVNTGTKEFHTVRKHLYSQQQKMVVKQKEPINPKGGGYEQINVNSKPFIFSFVLEKPKAPVPSEAGYTRADILPEVTGMPEVKSTGMFVDVSAGPTLLMPHLSASGNTARMTHKDYGTIRNKSETGIAGANVSAAVGFIKGRFSPSIGLGLSKNFVAANYDFTVSENPILDLDGTILGYRKVSAQTIRFSNKHSYTLLEIPVGLGVNVLQTAKYRIGLTGSFGPQLLMSVEGETPNPVFLEKRWTLKSTNFNVQAWSCQAGIVSSYMWKPDHYLFVKPVWVKNFGFKQVAGLYKSELDLFTVNFGIRKVL